MIRLVGLNEIKNTIANDLVKEYILKNLKRKGQNNEDEVKLLLSEWFEITEFKEHLEQLPQQEKEDSYLERRA